MILRIKILKIYSLIYVILPKMIEFKINVGCKGKEYHIKEYMYIVEFIKMNNEHEGILPSRRFEKEIPLK